MNHNPLPPYDDYAQVTRRTKYTYDAIDLSALKSTDNPADFPLHAGVEYEQGWLKQDIAPDVKFGVKCNGCCVECAAEFSILTVVVVVVVV